MAGLKNDANKEHESPAHWAAIFKAQVTPPVNQTRDFAFGTTSPSGQPHVRFCGHRGFWSVPVDNDHGLTSFQSDCPYFTTDVRMQKVRDIFGTDDIDACRGSGGGALCEATYWIKEDVMTEWRVRGRAWILSYDDVEEASPACGASKAREAILPYMKSKPQASAVPPESWRQSVADVFRSLKPLNRGQMRHPWPGASRAEGCEPDEGMGFELHAEDIDEADSASRRHFRVVVITPTEVEMIDLKDPTDDRRWVWELKSNNDEMVWKETELWP